MEVLILIIRRPMSIRNAPVPVEVLTSAQRAGGYPVLGDPGSRVYRSVAWAPRQGRVTGPDGDPLGIRVAERLCVGQGRGQSVICALTREWQTGRDPHWSEW